MSHQHPKKNHQDVKPIIGITVGDYNGVGPEVILKALAHPYLLKICTPVIYGSMKIFSKYRKILGTKDIFINQAQAIHQITHKKINLITVGSGKNLDIQPGKVSEEAGKFAYASLKSATEDLKNNQIHAMVTAPINKHTMQSKEFQFPGHTEYLTQSFGAKESLMLMVCENLRIGVVTGHVPLSEVSSLLTREKILKKIHILLKSLRQDFGIQKPKIAVLGFNPHAGEEGLLGDEEQQVIRPAILDVKKKGDLIYGPFSADSFFGTSDYLKFDAILAIYHDQGLIPFKTLAFERGVNYTAGLPFVRTSPDHGTAYDIAGKDQASDTSFREAIYLARDIVKARQAQEVLTS